MGFYKFQPPWLNMQILNNNIFIFSKKSIWPFQCLINCTPEFRINWFRSNKVELIYLRKSEHFHMFKSSMIMPLFPSPLLPRISNWAIPPVSCLKTLRHLPSLLPPSTWNICGKNNINMLSNDITKFNAQWMFVVRRKKWSTQRTTVFCRVLSWITFTDRLVVLPCMRKYIRRQTACVRKYEVYRVASELGSLSVSRRLNTEPMAAIVKFIVWVYLS